MPCFHSTICPVILHQCHTHATALTCSHKSVCSLLSILPFLPGSLPPLLFLHSGRTETHKLAHLLATTQIFNQPAGGTQGRSVYRVQTDVGAQLYPRNQIKHGAHLLDFKKTALPPSHLFLLIFPCETIVLSASCCLRLPFSEGARHHMNFSRNSLSALSLSVFEGLVSFFYICVFALHAFLPSFSLSDSFCLPWAGNECRAGRGCWRDSSQGRCHHILQSVTF